jgi:CelD/BcsL family acetyltransferase involved in cellulose biosynthesis
MFATHEGRDIGYIFGGMAGEIYRGQQFSFDDTWRDMSIGNLLQYEQLAWLCEEGAHRYDMGPLTGPFMEYKEHWTEIRLPIEAWILG